MQQQEFIERLGLKAKEFPGHISISQIRAYYQCPLSWFLKYGTNAEGKYPSRMLVGSLVHKGIEFANNLVYHGTKIDSVYLPTVMDRVESAIEDVNQDEYIFEDNPAEVFKQVRKVARAAVYAANDIPTPALVEHSIAGFELGPFYLDGYIDVVDKNGKVWDYKVGRSHKSQKDADKDIQLTIYAWAMGSYEVGFVSISSATGAYKMLDSVRTPEQIDACHTALECTAERLYESTCSESMTAFPPNLESTYGCAGCSFVGICPYGKVI